MSGEFAGWIVAALVAGSISCAIDREYGVSSVLGAIAAVIVAWLIYRRGESAEPGPTYFYCPKCQYYHQAERLKGEPGAI